MAAPARVNVLPAPVSTERLVEECVLMVGI
jgi:hypothetical protein